MKFKLRSTYQPRGDQPTAIDQLVRGIEAGDKHQVLLGVTGSGKTFTMAKVIEALDRPALVLAHNKTLAAQLYHEFKSFFPENAVEYFVSYYDYYQPEAYVPSADLYIDKESTINDELDKLRMSATRALVRTPRRNHRLQRLLHLRHRLARSLLRHAGLARKGPGDFRAKPCCTASSISSTSAPKTSAAALFEFAATSSKSTLRTKTTATASKCGAIRSMPSARSIRVTGEVRTGQEDLTRVSIYPKTHYVMPAEQRERAIQTIYAELDWWKKELERQGKFVEAQRVMQRTMFDIEMMRTVGYCHGVENYSRHLSGRLPGEAPPTLLDYFPQDYLLFVDESHQTIPQTHGMHGGDRSRKQVLVDYGFRMPSALDNRPLTFEEFEHRMNQVLYVSATPGPYELTKSGGAYVEQVIRPTGLIDPEVEIRPVKGQVDDLLEEIRVRAARNERVLVTTLTKRMAEDLSEYFAEIGVRSRYLHSEIETLDRIKILRDLRRGEFDVLIGINLLREGLDLPEVSLVAILDADKEGYLRSATSLIQTIGRCARHISGRAILYADRRTGSMEQAISETYRRREKQLAYNKENNITPESIVKSVDMELARIVEADYVTVPVDEVALDAAAANVKNEAQLAQLLNQLETQMREAAKKFEFEKAAQLRDRIRTLKQRDLAGLFPRNSTPLTVAEAQPDADTAKA